MTKEEKEFVKGIRDKITSYLMNDEGIINFNSIRIPVAKVEDVEQVKRIIMKFSFFHKRPLFINYLFTKTCENSGIFRGRDTTLYLGWLCIPKEDEMEMRSGWLPSSRSFKPGRDPLNYNLYEYEDIHKTPIGICYFVFNVEAGKEKIFLDSILDKMKSPDRSVKIDFMKFCDDKAWNDNEEKFIYSKNRSIRTTLV